MEMDGEVVIGVSVEVPGYPVAAFGFGIDASREADAMAAAREAARDIRNALELPCRAY